METFFDQIAAPFTINISPPLQQFGLTWGDYDGIPDIPEDNDVLMLKAYSGRDGTGELVASVQDFSTNAEFDETNLERFSWGQTSVRADSIASVVLIGGSGNFPHSLFYDNFELNNVPESIGSEFCLVFWCLLLLRYPRRASRMAL